MVRFFDAGGSGLRVYNLGLGLWFEALDSPKDEVVNS